MIDIPKVASADPFVRIGRLTKKITKLQTQRDYFKAQLEHYKHVIAMQPHLESRYMKYTEMKEEQWRVKDLENRCREQAKLIHLLEKNEIHNPT